MTQATQQTAEPATSQTIGALSLLVRDLDEADARSCGALGFDSSEASSLGGAERWDLLQPAF